MNFQLAKSGRSFKGAMTYFMHDKKEEGMKYHPTSSGRVAWSESVNCHGVGAHTAMRLMIATAEQADQLKRASGHKVTKKLEKPVYHFSLNWHPDELPDRDPEVMRAAALDALKVLGMDHLQAVLIVHQDEPHPHIHVVVNRVDPATGLAINTPPDFADKLERLCDEAELKQGRIFSPNRRQKLARLDARKAKKTANDFRVANDQAPVPDLEKSFRPPAQSPVLSEGSKLKIKADAVKNRHRAERDMLWRWFKPRLGGRVNYKQIAADHRRDSRPEWSAFGKQQAATRRTFRSNERIAFGPLLNAIHILDGYGWKEGMKGYFAALMKTWLGATAADRAVWLAKIQEREKADFAAKKEKELQARFAAAKAQHAEQKKIVEQELLHAKAVLHARQAQEREEISRQWKNFYEARPNNGNYAKHSRRNKKFTKGRKSREEHATPKPQPAIN